MALSSFFMGYTANMSDKSPGSKSDSLALFCDQPASVVFKGDSSAILFTKEIKSSLKGVMASKALNFLYRQTFTPLYTLHGKSPFYFYERMYSPEAVGKIDHVEGCGALNLVSVTEPLKVACMIIGLDDNDADELKIIPRLPAGWTEYYATNWPVMTKNGVTNINISVTASGKKVGLLLKSSAPLNKVSVRLPAHKGWRWQKFRSNLNYLRITINRYN